MQLPNSFTDSEHSVSQYLSGLKAGDSEATQKIWERYFKRLVQLADRKLKAAPRGPMDEDDVVQKVFAEFFAQVQRGRFPKLNDRDDLWQILAMLVDRRAKDQIRKLNRKRDGRGKVSNESAFSKTDGSSQSDVLATIPCREPCPDEAMEFVEALRSRLDLLSDETMREIALLKLQGYSNGEIVEKVRSSLRTVQRMLQKIRRKWSPE